MKESDIQAEIIQYLKARGIIVIRVNSGKINIGGRWINLAEEGTSDLIGCLKDGRFLAVEVKRPGETATEKQADFLRRVQKLGGIAICADCLQDVIDGIK